MPGRPRIASRSSSGGGPNCSWMYSSANTPRLVPCSITSAAPCRLVLTVTGGATAVSCPSVVAAVADSADAEAATEHSFSSVNFSSPTAGDRGMLTVTREEPVSLHSKRSCMTCCCCCTRGKKLGTVTATTLASCGHTRPMNPTDTAHDPHEHVQPAACAHLNENQRWFDALLAHAVALRPHEEQQRHHLLVGRHLRAHKPKRQVDASPPAQHCKPPWAPNSPGPRAP
eukprot:scaffold3613_cov331-Prasinococcus_capsulatus_cf.AAC.5